MFIFIYQWPLFCTLWFYFLVFRFPLLWIVMIDVFVWLPTRAISFCLNDHDLNDVCLLLLHSTFVFNELRCDEFWWSTMRTVFANTYMNLMYKARNSLVHMLYFLAHYTFLYRTTNLDVNKIISYLNKSCINLYTNRNIQTKKGKV